MLPVIAALNAYREAREITFDELSAEMKAADVDVPARTLAYMARPPRGYRPRFLTVKKIERFLGTRPPKVTPERRHMSAASAASSAR